MGNIFSRQLSLRDLLLSLDEKITALEESIESLENNKYSLTQYLYIFFILIIPVLIIIIPSFGKITVIYAFFICLVVYFVKKVYEFILDKMIQNRKIKLRGLKEIQKKRIEELKKEISYVETKQLIEKYEKESPKKKSEKGIVDTLAGAILGKDEPSRMYALVCEKCYSHNGLVHPNEYKFTKYKCYKCNALNDKREK
ncbi:integral membrane metal-binding protein [Tubulinosema ratisbonensis]|uniref:Endoplasmic reticulum junction formation protein lunapark n=1 Tax=Tubulinosema ratisbonensis TaxID=291195 RepID=A0A437AMT0_9MICR|nr:integral membrane metal-binding protein [Tubulinosema ratisbonensis]